MTNKLDTLDQEVFPRSIECEPGQGSDDKRPGGTPAATHLLQSETFESTSATFACAFSALETGM